VLVPPFSRSELHVLDDAEAATFVTLPTTSRYFLPFLARERSAAQVARELGVDAGSVGYRVRQMIQLNLIHETRSQKRAGRPIRYYRSVADRIFAPLSLTPISGIRDLFALARAGSTASIEASLENAWLEIARVQQWGTHLYRPAPDAAPNRDFVPENLTDSPLDFWDVVLSPRTPPVWDQHAIVHLTRQEAKEVQRELSLIVDRYSHPQTEQRREPYVLQLAFARSIEREGRRNP
jgi:hypothetical protein